MISKNLENHIRQYIAVHYLEQNNEQLKTDNEGNFDLTIFKEKVYLINSVLVLKSKEKPELNLSSDWISYWASLTFQNN